MTIAASGVIEFHMFGDVPRMVCQRLFAENATVHAPEIVSPASMSETDFPIACCDRAKYTHRPADNDVANTPKKKVST